MTTSCAVVIPCRNEEATIADVVFAFSSELPTAKIWVIDNGSTDATASRAMSAGAEVLSVSSPGKGRAIREAFAQIDSDIYIMVDGDGTYDPATIKPALQEFQRLDLDFSTGVRHWAQHSSRRTPLQSLGGVVTKALLSFLYGKKVSDPLSGLRIISRRFLGNVRLLSSGFELEVELTSLALLSGARQGQFAVSYCERSSLASESKIRAFRDGYKIVGTILSVFIRNRLRNVSVL